jgi:hypothetical protein
VPSWQNGTANQIEVFRAQDGSTLLIRLSNVR